MTKPAAFRATIHGFKTVPTRKVISITIECPIEQQAEVARICEHGAWVAVARLQEASTKDVGNSTSPPTSAGRPAPAEESRATKPHSNPLAQKSALLGNDPRFWAFVTETYHPFRVNNKDEAKVFIRHFCRVDSRADIKDDPEATERLRELESNFLVWRDHPELVSR